MTCDLAALCLGLDFTHAARVRHDARSEAEQVHEVRADGTQVHPQPRQDIAAGQVEQSVSHV